jgi:ABC-type xylose transport system substrate-binding protein
MTNHTTNELTPEQEAIAENTGFARLEELAKTSTALARSVATNPNASPELLEELAKNRDKKIRQNLAANPNTPTQVLIKLGATFPFELLENPVFSLLLLENPNFLEEMPQETLLELLRCPSVPESFLEWAISQKNSQIEQAVAENPGTPSTILELMADKASSGILRNIGANPNTPESVLEKLADKRDSSIRKAVAKNPKIPDRLVEKLARDREASSALIENENLSPPLLTKLAEQKN